MEKELASLRSALNATSNVGGVEPVYGAVEIEAKMNKIIADASPKFSELRNMIPRVALKGTSTEIWNVRTSDNTSTSWGYSTSEGGSNTNTPAQGAKKQLFAAVKSVRTDWEVENYMKLASASYYDAVADELNNAVAIQVDQEEKQIVSGTDAGAYGDADGFIGLKQIINSFVTIGDTSTVYGVTRASGKTYMDATVVDKATGAFAISDLDAMITAQRKVKGMPGMFIVSYERADEINSKLQAQQRFTGTLNIEGGFTVATYRGIPIISSRYMDKNGASDTDTALYLTHAGNFEMKVGKENSNTMIAQTRADSLGGFLSAFEFLKCKELTKNVILDDVAVPA